MSAPSPEAPRAGAAGLPTRIYLVGFMGCGKSRIGALVAERLGYALLDLDAQIEREQGTTIRSLFASVGESAFRDLEHRCLQASEKWQNAVIATGGGVMAYERNRLVLAALGTTVWLDVPFDVIVGRMSEEGRRRRPLFDDPESARRLYRERLGAYALADHRVAVADGDAAPDVAGRLIDLLRAQSCAI